MKKILIVDDDEQIIRAIKKILTRNNYDTDTAENGQVALDKLAQNNFDLIITDIIMPQKEGIELIRDLRKNYPDLPVIAMSGGGRVEPENYLDVAQKLGADCMLKKPFSTEELLNLLRDVLPN